MSPHAQPRATKDIDLFIKPHPDNAKAVYAALAQFGAPLEGLTAEDFTVLVQREMESWRSPLASIPSFSAGQSGRNTGPAGW